MGKFILIMVIYSGGLLEEPTVEATSAIHSTEFNSKASCQSAANVFKTINQKATFAFCIPKD